MFVFIYLIGKFMFQQKKSVHLLYIKIDLPLSFYHSKPLYTITDNSEGL